MKAPKFKKLFAQLPSLAGRTFNDLTGTPLARLRLKSKWHGYPAALLGVRTVRSAAEQWLARFHGVVSWRLPNYLGWHRALDGGRVTSVEQLPRIAIELIHS